MKYIILTVLFLCSCGTENLLEDGKYKVYVRYDVDYCVCTSVQGETDIQEWEVESNTVYLFRRTQKFIMTADGNKLIYSSKENGQSFHLELYPGKKKKGFKGFWYNDIPNVMLTISSVSGKKKEE